MLVDSAALIEIDRETGGNSVAEYLSSLKPVKEYENPSLTEGAIVYAFFEEDTQLPSLSPEKYNLGKYVVDLTEVPGSVVLTPLVRGSEPVEPIDLDTFMARGYSNGLMFKVSWVPEAGEYAPFYRRI